MNPELSSNGDKLRLWGAVFFMLLTEIILLNRVPRSDFLMNYGLILIMFLFYFYILYNKKLFSLSTCIRIAILLRIIALFNEPVLSDDYFRFIWDGKMMLAHINPFHYTPQEYILGHRPDVYLNYLLANMNSPEYHTIYPPVMQYLFAFAVWLFPTNVYGSMLVMKLFIFAAELFSLRLLYLYALKKNIGTRNILWYALNPLIIVELTGNVHFEGLLLCFFLALLYYLDSGKYKSAGIFWALAVCTKMIPLILAPLLFRYMGWRKFILFCSLALGTMLLLTLPFLSVPFIEGIRSSGRLFFHLFEFNAPVLYLIRSIAYHYVDYDIIEEVAPKLAVISLILILMISFWPTKKFSFETKSLWIFSIYFLFSTMVHPWYPAILILLCVFTRYKFPIIFSLLIPLSYFPYRFREYDENMWIILLEYGMLFIFLMLEWRSNIRQNHSLLYLQKGYSTPN